MDNYKNSNNEIILANRLNRLKKEWDSNEDGVWNGYTPDYYFNFDSQGFDLNPKSQETGWRSFAYNPFLGDFWPANGSSDDVLIRLHPILQQNSNHQFDREVYRLNLAIVESLIKRQDVVITAVDEKKYNVDLDKNGELGQASKVVFEWNPRAKKFMSYVGAAKEAQKAGSLHLAGGLFPEGIEFLHSVRYLDIKEGRVVMAQRMKELRYAKKVSWFTYSEIKQLNSSDVTERYHNEDKLHRIGGDFEHGMNSAKGWRYQGFIEDAKGDLRPQSNEETLYCMGCHRDLGATSDGIFSFARKVESNEFQEGWFHWSQKGFKGLKERVLASGEYEYTKYLKHNKSGNAFRTNTSIEDKFFTKNGTLNKRAVAKIHQDISYVILPDTKKTDTMNKAYLSIVKEQSFNKGRDAHVKPLQNVHKEIKQGQSTELDVVVN